MDQAAGEALQPEVYPTQLSTTLNSGSSYQLGQDPHPEATFSPAVPWFQQSLANIYQRTQVELYIKI